MPESDSYVNTPDNDIGDKISENDTNTSVSNSNDKMTVSESKVTKNRSVPSTFSHCIKRRKLERGYTNTFRVSCRFSGYARKQLNVQRTSQQMGVLISKLLGWKIDLKHPKYEINIHLGDGTFTVGIPLTDIPLSKRSYIKHCGLRTPIAYIMANLVDICPGNVILDPMCGCATILMEASKVCLTAAYIGIDNDITQLRLAAENIEHCDKMNSCMSLIHGDTTHIPLSKNSMDGVITDAPFGQNHVVTENIYTFYGKMLSELTRIVKHRGKIVLLTSSDMVHFVTELCSDTLTNIMSSETVTRVEGDEVPKEVGTFENGNGSQVKDVTKINRQEVSIKYSKNSNIDINSHFPLFLKAAHNVKLGETEGCILVLQKSARTKLPCKEI